MEIDAKGILPKCIRILCVLYLIIGSGGNFGAHENSTQNYTSGFIGLTNICTWASW